jgi:hypothetical protein
MADPISRNAFGPTCQRSHTKKPVVCFLDLLSLAGSGSCAKAIMASNRRDSAMTTAARFVNSSMLLPLNYGNYFARLDATRVADVSRDAKRF